MRASDRLFGHVLSLIAALLLAEVSGHTQVDTGAIWGTVKDQSGAVVPNAKVTLTNEATSFSISTTTAGDGSYIFTPIKVGTYAVMTEATGFKKATHLHVTVNIQQQVVVDFELVPGAITQVIEVTAAPPLLQTQNASVGQVAGTRELNDLPLNGRNYTFLAQLAAGVTQQNPTGRGLEGTGSFSANGLSTVHNNYLLDGIDNNNDTVDFLNGAAYAIRPPVDAIQEFKVQTGNFSAEFGRAGGAVLNATIKSGTNQLHGGAWEFVRNDKFDAANFFQNSPIHVDKGEFRRNQFGFTLGGPAVIPRVYHGKNKTFFFGDYEGTRIRQAAPWLVSVPTARERVSGYTDLSELISNQGGPNQLGGTRTDLLGRTFQLGTVFDPATTRTVRQGQPDLISGLTATKDGFVRDPFYTGPGGLAGVRDFTTPAQIAFLNQLAASRLDPNAMALLNLYPLPNGPGIFNNFSVNRVTRDDINQFDVRMDQNFSEKDQMFGRVSYSDEPNFKPGPFEGKADGGLFSQGDFKDVDFGGALSETHSFSPNLINEVRLGYSRIHTTQLQPFAGTTGIPGQFGIRGIPQVPGNGGLPTLTIGGLQQLGSNPFLPGDRVSDTTQMTENLTRIYGSHTFKGGFEYQSLRHPWLAPARPRGEFIFSGTFTEVPTAGGGRTGLAQLLLIPARSSVSGGFDNVGGANSVLASNFAGPDDNRKYYAAYFQDDWKLTPRLTLNLGLRWEYFGQIVERYGAYANFVPGPPGAGAEYIISRQRQNTPLSSSFTSLLATDGIRLSFSDQPGLTNTPLNDFAPRVGLTYEWTPKLVMRGGYGIYYAGFESIGGSPDLGSNYPFLYNFSFPAPDAAHPVTYADGSVATLENGLTAVPLTDPSGVIAKRLGLQGLQQNYKTQYTQEYNLSFQYQLTPNQSVQLAYVGNTSHHLLTSPGLNQTNQILPIGTDRTRFIPFPDFGIGSPYVTTQGNSYYHGLQLTFERRFSHGLTLLADYTFSKCRRAESNLLGVGNGGGFRAPYLPGFGIRGDYALCGFDVPQIVHFSGTYQLPFGKGRHFASSAGGVLDHVIGGWSTNWILTLQDGFPFTVSCPIGTTANFGCNALLVPGQNIYATPHSIDHWLNAGAFANPPAATAIGQADYAPLGGAPTQAHGPGFRRLDLSLFKGFQTSERTRLEFRTEFFNLTNTPQFANPSFLDFTNKTNFGKITGLRDGVNDPRQIQFALKLYW